MEYATGASCFQDVAILSGLMDANGAAILDNEDTNEHQQNVTAATAEEEAIITRDDCIGAGAVCEKKQENLHSISGDIMDARVDAWNSSSCFSTVGESLNDSAANTEHHMNNLCPNDQIGRGGGYIGCPSDQIGRGGELRDAQISDGLQTATSPQRATSKRKFSPVGDSPMGRIRKMSTSVEASPALRSRLVLFSENQEPNMEAPDLVTGIGRLVLKGGETTADRPAVPQNIINRMMGQSMRQRTISCSGGAKEKRKSIHKKKPRTQSLTSQKRIDDMLSPGTKLAQKKVVPEPVSKNQ